MRKLKRALWFSFGIAWLLGCNSESSSVRHPLDISALDLKGARINPFQDRREKATVLFFVRTDCPISNRYAPEIQRLASKYSSDAIAFWLVYPDGTTSPQEIERHREDYHLSLQALRDPRHALVKIAKVTVTPEAAVFLPDGQEIYRGRIDDRYIDFGKERPSATTHDLDDILNSIIRGSSVAGLVTRAVGCYIE